MADCLQVFELDHGKAWRSVLTSVVSMAASLYLISISPWYLLPFAWFLSGTAFTGVGLAERTRRWACTWLSKSRVSDIQSEYRT